MKKLLSVIVCISLALSLIPVGGALALSKRPSYLFAIDAGHGGGDPGCIGADRRYESNDNIKVAQEVISLLNKQGQRTYLINRNLKTQERPVEANGINADFLISLHRDSSTSPTPSGINIYTHEPSHTQQVKQPEKDYAPAEWANKHSIDTALVNNLYSCLTGATALPVASPHYGSASAPIWEDYYINRISNMPSCIIELGFASNPNDNAIFDANYKTLAVAIVKALLATVGLEYVGPFTESTIGAIIPFNNQQYYVINGAVAWDFSGDVEYNQNIYNIENGGVTDVPIAPVGGKAGFTDECKWLFYQNALKIFGKGVTDNYGNEKKTPWDTSVTSLTVENDVTVLGTALLDGCEGLTTVTLPKSLTEIKDGAFNGCTGIETVNYYGTKADFEKITIGENNSALLSAEILYVCDIEGHKYEFDCQTKCSVCGELRTTEVGHIYTSDCDEDCNICGELRTTATPHTYTSDCDELCDICQHKREKIADHSFNDSGICVNCGAVNYIAGDVNSDLLVTDADAVYLLMYTFFPDEYPVGQPCDFNGDGIVTDADAVYLLMYTFFPDEYPIQL